MKYKEIWVPMPVHIQKFLKKEYKHDDGKFILTSQRLLRPASRTPSSKISDYFLCTSRKHNYPWVNIVTNDTRLYKIYAFIRGIEGRFTEKMFDRIYNGVMPPTNKTAASMIRIFLDDYEITPSEYSEDRAYKKWQRSQQYQNVKIHERNQPTNQWKQ